jgi:hypothetical protein
MASGISPSCYSSGNVNIRSRWLAAAALLLTGCAPKRAEQPKEDPTKNPAYAETVRQLASVNQLAEALMKGGLTGDAAAAIKRGQSLQAPLLSAPRPTLEAMEAVSDLDDLYARMLLADHQDGWARTTYEKNRARWKSWKPQSDETARRLKQAEVGMAECDRRLKP